MASAIWLRAELPVQRKRTRKARTPVSVMAANLSIELD
jgi:hypothetical protein